MATDGPTRHSLDAQANALAQAALADLRRDAVVRVQPPFRWSRYLQKQVATRDRALDRYVWPMVFGARVRDVADLHQLLLERHGIPLPG